MITDENKIYEIFMTFKPADMYENEDHLAMDAMHFVAKHFAAYKLEQAIQELKNIKHLI